MNQQYAIANKWFSKHPILSEKAFAQWKIFIVSFFLFNIILSIGVKWGVNYPTATQRGLKPQSAHYRPLLVEGFELTAGGLRTDRQAELYAKGHVDDFAFKEKLYSNRYMW